MFGNHTCGIGGYIGECGVCRAEREAQSNCWGSVPTIQRLEYKELIKMRMGRLGVKTDKEIYLEKLLDIKQEIVDQTRYIQDKPLTKIHNSIKTQINKMWLFFIVYIPITMFLVGYLLLEVVK